MAKTKQPATTPKTEEPVNLTDKELAFCIEYSVSRNATKSYQRAYKCGYNTARSAGCLLLQNIAIKSTIDEMAAERNERLKIDADDTLRKIKLLSEYDASDFFDDTGRLKPLSDLHPDLRFVVEGMDIAEKFELDTDGASVPSRLTKIKLPKKKEALELLAKCQQMLTGTDPGDTLPPAPSVIQVGVVDARKHAE